MSLRHFWQLLFRAFSAAQFSLRLILVARFSLSDSRIYITKGSSLSVCLCTRLILHSGISKTKIFNAPRQIVINLSLYSAINFPWPTYRIGSHSCTHNPRDAFTVSLTRYIRHTSYIRTSGVTQAQLLFAFIVDIRNDTGIFYRWCDEIMTLSSAYCDALCFDYCGLLNSQLLIILYDDGRVVNPPFSAYPIVTIKSWVSGSPISGFLVNRVNKTNLSSRSVGCHKDNRRELASLTEVSRGLWYRIFMNPFQNFS